MSSTDRLNRLLLAEDWKKVYQSFRNADFKSYDFDNLRRSMINYLRQNYPEDFNDYLESSEYLALIDLIAFLGQNIAFRIDLNARENFIELAERRESVLRLARLLSYNAKRNQAANGLLKIESVTTTEEIIDSNNVNLSNQTIIWNDPSNEDWYEQFVKVMNAVLPVNTKVGRPSKTDTVNGIPVELYQFNSNLQEVPVFSFTKSIDGRNTAFEIVSVDLNDGTVEELAPLPTNKLAFIYKDDGRGNASTNTGFFFHFRQGVLQQGEFNVNLSIPNQIVSIDATNINQSDVWLYSLDTNQTEKELWTKVSATEGNNVIYNSTAKSIRNIYSVITRTEDRINLQFADGTFGNLPKGAFRIYYRTSDNRQFKIVPGDMTNIQIVVPYVSTAGKDETLTIVLALQYTVDNATNSESDASIKTNAPSTYYTQNRMITGEDYNVAPLAVNQEIIKIKSVNRVSSGISRYFDLLDATGKYSSTNLYGKDGIIYKETINDGLTFSYVSRTDIEGIINNSIEPILSNTKLFNFYLNNFNKILITDIVITWIQTTKDTNLSTGYLTDPEDNVLEVSSFTDSILKYLEIGAKLKFEAPAGKYFTVDGKLLSGSPVEIGDSTVRWTTVINVIDNGTVTQADDSGPIIFNDVIPTGAVLVEILAKFTKYLTADVKLQMLDEIFANNTFGLRYNVDTRTWDIIDENNLNLYGDFSTGKTGDISNQQLDASWLLLFTTDTELYTVTYRGVRYVFESDKEIRFYYDSTDKNYNTTSGKVIKDKITVLSINNAPDSFEALKQDIAWQVVAEYRDAQGYVDSKKIEITFFDSDDDGLMDDPESFDNLIPANNYIYQKKIITTDGVEDYRYVNAVDENIVAVQNVASIGSYHDYTENTNFYITEDNVFKTLNVATTTLSDNSDYKAFTGRSDLKFQYVHSTDVTNRIDPSVTNIIDIYLLTRTYDSDFRSYLDGNVDSKPLPMSSDSMYNNFGKQINLIKSISDEVIYHPVKYKILFGNKSESKFQAVFKVVKNSSEVVNDDDVKVRVIEAINEYFALENWDFGDIFYFSELSAYVMNQLAPDIVTFVIVPDQATQTFGSLFEIKSESDEIFISGATVDDVEIIDAVTASRLKASGTVVSSTSTSNVGITSTATSSGSTV
jgi:RNase P/RNase MRP subunit p29